MRLVKIRVQLLTRRPIILNNMADVIVIDSGSEPENNDGRNEEKYILWNVNGRSKLTCRLARTIAL